MFPICILSLCPKFLNRAISVSPRIMKKGGGIEHLEAVYALAHTLLAYTTILCCVNTVTVKMGCCTRLPPFGGNTGSYILELSLPIVHCIHSKLFLFSLGGAGSAGVVWFVFWVLLAHSTPADHPRISPTERNYIESSLESENTRTKVLLQAWP